MERLDVDLWTAKEVARLLSLVENERRYYQEMINLVPVSLAVVSPDMVIQSVNRAFRRHFSLSQGEARDKRLDECIPNPLMVEVVKAMFRTGNATMEPQVAVPGNGSYRVNALPIRDWGDDTRTEALVVLEEMAAGRAPEPPLTDSLEAVLWEADPGTGKYWLSGRKAEELFRWNAETWKNRVLPADQERWSSLWREALELDKPVVCEYRGQTGDGRTVFFRDTFRRIQDAAGQTKLAGMTEDITRQWTHHEQRLQAEKMDGITRLSGRLAHDFNNLLLIVQGFGEHLLESFAPDDPRRADMAEILKAGDRIAQVSNQLLAISRPQAVHPKRIDLNRLVEGVERKLEHQLPAHTRVELTVTGAQLVVSADPAQLEACLESLVLHAVHSLPSPGRLRIEVGKEAFLEDHIAGMPRGTYAAIRIGEIGAGAAPDPQAFEPFSLKAAAKETSVKESVGLAPIYAVLRQNQAPALAFRQAAGGIGFLVYLPLAKGAVESPAVVEPLTMPAPAPVHETVLVVDDEAGIRNLISKILSRQGYQVLEAGSAEQALALAGQYEDTIHLVVCDVLLPEMEGPDLVENLRKNRPQLRVLYISGYTDNAALYSGTLPQGTGFLAKPFTLHALVESVKTILETPASGAAGA